MNITSITTVEGNPLQSATGLWKITSPAGEPPLRFFRRVARLRFETGGMADRIEVDPEAATLKAAFGPFDYDALSPGDGPLGAKLAASGGTVVVALDAPRRVRQIHLPAGKAGHSVHLYRLDGDALAAKPTVTAKVQSKKSVDASPAVEGMVVKQPSGVVVATLPANADFIDRRFAIRLEEPADPSLGAGDLLGIKLRGYPTGPRLGLANPEDLDSAVFFWQAAGEVGGEVSAGLGNVEAGEAFARTLGRYLDDLFARLAGLTDEDGRPLPTPEFVEVDLVAASDAPCVLDVTAFDVAYHLVVRSLYSERGEKVEKRVLRLTGDGSDVRGVSVRLPGGAAVRSATLETVESFRDDRLLSSDEAGSPDAALAQKEGVYVGVERWAAQGVTPPRATSVSGVAVALMATAEDTGVLVELQEDWRGQPSGRKLAAGAVTLGRVGRRNWATLMFPEAIVLPSTPHWILVKAASGRAIWLADADGVPVRVLEGPDDPSARKELGVLDGLQALYEFVSRSERAREQRPASLGIGEHVVAATGGEGDARTYDLTSAINDRLAALPPSPPAQKIPLAFGAALPGFIIVYPPTIEYDLKKGAER